MPSNRICPHRGGHRIGRSAETIERLEQENRERTEAEQTLLAGLARDMNTPITVLRGHAENLTEHDVAMVAGNRQQIYNDILELTPYVQTLVEDLLTLGPLFDTLMDTYHPLSRFCDMVLLADTNGSKVVADPVRLR